MRLYSFLSQIFDYGNTAIEKRAIFYRRLLPLLEFGREREGIDLSKVRADPPHAEGPGQARAGAAGGEYPTAGAADRGRRRRGAREGKGLLAEIIEQA